MRGVFLYVVSIWSANMVWRPMAMVRVDPTSSWKMSPADGMYTQTGGNATIRFLVDVPADFPRYEIGVTIFPPTTRIEWCSTDAEGKLARAPGSVGFYGRVAPRTLECLPSQSSNVGIGVPVVRPVLSDQMLFAVPVKLRPSMVVFGGSLAGFVTVFGTAAVLVDYLAYRGIHGSMHFTA
jgi:hypothetical protein